MVELIKRKRMEKYIKFFISNVCTEYPFYLDNLIDNINLTMLAIKFCNELDVPKDYDYEKEFTLEESINLACEILDSISCDLKDRLLLEIENENIEFTEGSFSYLEIKNGINIIYIKDSKNIATSLVLIHEFFHLLHLEQVNYEGENNNYYCYTETLGISGDLYSFFYLLNNKEDLIDELKTYISHFINRMIIKVNDSFVEGFLVAVYNEEKSLSRKAISNYINKYNLSSSFLDILKNKPDARLDYYDDIRYIYSTPKAIVFSYNLYKEEYIRNNFTNIISDLSKMSYIEWENKYINQYINNEEVYLNLVNKLLNEINKLYNKDSKVKKIGEI